MALSATRTVEIGFSSNPGTAIGSTTWTNVSADVRDVTIKRGRQIELDQFAAGTCTVTLNNRARRYDPQYTGAGAPYNGNILPMRRIRVRAAYNAITYDLFSGYIDGWEQLYDPPNDAVAVVTATDAFKVFANTQLPTTYAVEVRADAPTHWWRLGEAAGSTTVSDGGSAAAAPGTATGVTFGTTSVPTHDSDTAATFPNTANNSIVVPAAGTARPLTVEMWFRATTVIPAGTIMYSQVDGTGSTVREFVVGIGNAGGVGFVGETSDPANGVLGTTSLKDGNPHHLAVTVSSTGLMTLYVDGIAEGTPVTSSVVALAAGGTLYIGNRYSDPATYYFAGDLDEVAVYNSTLSAARIAAHSAAGHVAWRNDLSGARVGRILDAAGWPTADRNIDAGISVLQSADLNTTALGHLQKIEATEQALLFISAAGQVRFIGRTQLNSAPYNTPQATFGDAGAELPYANIAFTYNDQLLYNEISVSRTGGIVQTVSDATSQAAYLKRSQTIDGLLNNSDAASRDLANYRLAIYKDPLDRLTGLTVAPERIPASLYPQVLGREVGDRITVKRRPQAVGSAISQDANIEGIAHTITPDSWVTTWNLSPSNVLQFWIVGVAGASEAGQTTRAGY